MSEIEQLKNRIADSGPEGIPTAQIREDYDPAGPMMIHNLCESGEFVSRKEGYEWRVFLKRFDPQV